MDILVKSPQRDSNPRPTVLLKPIISFLSLKAVFSSSSRKKGLYETVALPTAILVFSFEPAGFRFQLGIGLLNDLSKTYFDLLSKRGAELWRLE